MIEIGNSELFDRQGNRFFFPEKLVSTVTSPLFLSKRFFYTFGPHDPSIRVENGQSLTVVCPDSDNALADGTELTNDQRQTSPGSDLFEGNPLAGPIYVEGAKAGDCLAVKIEKIELDRDWGRTLLAPAHGLLSSDHFDLANTDPGSRERVPRHLYRWKLDRERATAQLENPLGEEPFEIPLHPMVGAIGVCPPWGQSISTLFAGSYGGNLDLSILDSGATIMLPVYQEGGLLLLGDIHAAQGHGEIVGGGIETSGQVHVTIRNLAGCQIAGPRIVTETHLYAVATDGDLRTAISRASGRLVDWLTDPLGCNRWDAYQLMSQTCSFEIGGIVAESCSSVAAGIPIEHLPMHCQKRLEDLLRCLVP